VNRPAKAPLLLVRPERARRPGSERAPDILVVHNPGAPRFSAADLRSALDEVLGPLGLRHHVHEVPPREAESAVRRHVARALRDGCRRIVAAGGDGTVSMVAQCLVRHRDAEVPISLGIIPVGTTNVLARELGIPMGLKEAIAAAASTDHAIQLDAIQVGRRFVFTQVGIGPDALMIRDTPRAGQERFGRLAYMLTFARRAFGYRPRWFTIRMDGHVVHERAWQLIAANVGSVGAPPFTYGPRIDPTDGAVDLCVYNVRRKRDYGKVVWRILAGRHRRDDHTRFHRFRERVVIESNRPALVQGDGEIIGTTPVTLRVIPQALRVLVARAVEGTVGHDTRNSPPESDPEAQASAAGETTPPTGDSVGADVERMMAQHSRTWALQGVLRHPFAAVEALDAAIFLRVNNLFFGAVTDKVLWFFSRFFHYGEGWVVVVLVMVLVDLRSGLRTAAVALPALWATMLTVNLVLKKVFRRRRPFIAFVKARVIGPRPRDFSFPSGHSAAGFAGAVLLGSHAPTWAPLFYLFALAVGFSRIYLGVHYPSDVAMGALAGSILAVAYQALIRLILGGLA
jgi:diacylglycerol kinase (ATP)